MIHMNLNQKDNTVSSNQVIIKFNPRTDKKTISNLHSRINAVIIEENSLLGYQVVSSTKSANELLSYYKSLKETEYVKLNYTVHIA